MSQVWTPHPVIKLPTQDQVRAVLAMPGGVARLQALWEQREERIKAMVDDPLRYGYEPKETTGKLRELIAGGANDICTLGGNRSGKSNDAAKILVEILMAGKDRRAWAFQETEKACIDRQQPYVYQFLPPEIRDIGKVGKITNVKYNRKNGFSEGAFVLPTGGFCRFMNYEMKDTAFEGERLHVAWLDELAPPDLVETIRFRLLDYSGLLLLTFTPIKGYTVTVKQYLEGARIIETMPAPLLPQDQVLVQGCPKGHMPYVLECQQKGRYVLIYFSQFNPFGQYQNLVKLLQTAKLDDVKCRAYGWPTKQISGAFPKFTDAAHVIPADKVPKEGTNYLSIDPAGARNYFMVWIRVTPSGQAIIYREWPDISVGAWAEPSEKWDGKPGPGQRNGAGMGVAEIKRMILRLEGWRDEEMENFNSILLREDDDRHEVIYKRLIDPRAGATQVAGQDEGTSLIDLFAEESKDTSGKVTAPGMYVLPAPGGRIEEGVGLINDMLAYDSELPVTIENYPGLVVSSACQNTIYSLKTWTGVDGEKGASKDPVDAVRYAVKEGLVYIERNRGHKVRRGGGVY